MSAEITILNDYYIPKEDTQQTTFLEKYPQYDGRGVVMAIIDSGIDVSSPGLQHTTTGLPKIIDSFEFSGVGNVNTSIVRKADNNNIINGLSGRLLKIPTKWKNPSGKWHLGITSYEILCYRTLFKDFIEKQKTFRENVSKNIKNKECKNNSQSESSEIVDCIVWFDGEKWRACIDTSFSKELEDIKILTNYRDEHEFGVVCGNKSYCVTISDYGNLLQIIFSFFEHGTAVAHIAASHFPNEQHKDGLAPGAQIISIYLQRYMENDLNYCCKKAFLKCIELGVDIINLSTTVPDDNPEMLKLVEDVVEKHGIIVIKATGNFGPNYFSVKEDYLDFYEKFFIIGSILTPNMAKNLYNCEKLNSPILYSYSARGPSNSDSRGIDFVGPGAANTNFPQWHSPLNKFCVGTSFAAPNVAGSIACLLSALQANSIFYTPAMIKMALANTAFLPNNNCEALGYGNGIIQINDAYEYLKALPKTFSTGNLISASLSLSESNQNVLTETTKKGIIWIKKNGSEQNFKTFNLKIKVANNTCISWTLKSSPESTKFLQYSNIITENMFLLKLDTTILKSGSINYAEIHGYNNTFNPSIGPYFSFPITVIIPEEPNYPIKKTFNLKPEIPEHIFLQPPDIATRCIIKLNAVEEKTTVTVYFQYTNEKPGICVPQKLKFNPRNLTQQYDFRILERVQIYEISFYKFYSSKQQANESLKFNLEIDFD